MRKITLISILIVLAITTFAQPQFFKYQTVVRDGLGDLIQNQPVNLKMSIRENSPSGPIIYQEYKGVTTNEFGLATYNLGTGTILFGTFNGIHWSNNIFYLQTELDINDGSGYVDMGTSQLGSVPFALHAETSDDSFWEIIGSDLYYNNGNVGIGTNNPSNLLHVAGDMRIEESSPYLNFYSGAMHLGFIGVWSDYNMNVVNRSSTGALKFGTNSIERLRIDNVGNVGIGLTNPTELLHIDGNMRLEGSLLDGYNNPGTSGQILQSTGTETNWVDAASLSDGDWTISGDNLYSSVTGDVGIGVITPDAKFTVREDFPSTNTVEDVMSIWRGSTGTVANGIGAGLIFRNEVNNSGYALSGRISSVMENINSLNSQAGLLFETKNGTSGMVNALYIDPIGYVGIGTSTPDQQLSVHTSSGISYIRVSDNTTGPSSGLRMGCSGSGNAYIINDEDTKSLSLGTEGTSQMRINADGWVGINDLYPDQTVHIKQHNANKGLRIEHQSTTDYWESGVGTTTKNYKFYYNDLFRADISSVDGSYTQSSDRRLKRDIDYMGPVLSKVTQLKPATYHYIDGDATAPKSTGFIAQEVEELFPDLVRETDDGYKGLVYDGFAVISIKAIQELNDQLIQMQQEIDELKEEMKDK